MARRRRTPWLVVLVARVKASVVVDESDHNAQCLGKHARLGLCRQRVNLRARLLKDARNTIVCRSLLEHFFCVAVPRLSGDKPFVVYVFKIPSSESHGISAVISMLSGTLLDMAVGSDASDRNFADELVFNDVLSKMDVASGAIWKLVSSSFAPTHQTAHDKRDQ